MNLYYLEGEYKEKDIDIEYCETVDRMRESYIDGIWNKEKEEDWLTELQVPIEKAK